ncbi:MAG: hypothetical protein HYY23_03715, partial [Verrucomicrobia bacterium]|nr:hypothetical protein [Verrucomicrobiota bacterium]
AVGFASLMIFGGILAKSIHSSMQDPASWAAFAVKAREFSRVTEQAGAVLGLGVGLAMGQRWAPFEVHASWFRRLACWVLGCGCLGALYFSRKIGPADSEMIRAAVRSAGAGLSTGLMTCVVPWLCLRWKLAEPASPTSREQTFSCNAPAL